MENRKRKIQIIVRITEKERMLITEKMKQLPTGNLAAYARKMLIDGYIILLDTAEIKAHSTQLQKIGGNINQIAKRINETAYYQIGGTVYEVTTSCGETERLYDKMVRLIKSETVTTAADNKNKERYNKHSNQFVGRSLEEE